VRDQWRGEERVSSRIPILEAKDSRTFATWDSESEDLDMVYGGMFAVCVGCSAFHRVVFFE